MRTAGLSFAARLVEELDRADVTAKNKESL